MWVEQVQANQQGGRGGNFRGEKSRQEVSQFPAATPALNGHDHPPLRPPGGPPAPRRRGPLRRPSPRAPLLRLDDAAAETCRSVPGSESRFTLE